MKRNIFILLLFFIIITPFSSFAYKDKFYEESFGNIENINNDIYYENDPLEKFNRIMFSFNKLTDIVLVKPVTISYNKFMPIKAKISIRNAFSNLKEPYRVLNYLAQGEVKDAYKSAWRFIINSTAGILGLFDVAKQINLTTSDTGLAETFAFYGLKSGPYIVLPLLNVGTFIDQVDRLSFTAFNPVNLINQDEARTIIYAVNFVDTKTQYMNIMDHLTRHAIDEYALVRTTYLQNRKKRLKLYCANRKNFPKKVCQVR